MPFSFPVILYPLFRTLVRLIKLQNNCGTFLTFVRKIGVSVPLSCFTVPLRSHMTCASMYYPLPIFTFKFIFLWLINPLTSFVIWLDAPESAIQMSFLISFRLKFLFSTTGILLINATLSSA